MVCDDEAWLVAFGLVPQVEAVTEDDLVQEVVVPISESEELHVTWDVVDASVRIRYRRDANVVVDIFREQATWLGIDALGDSSAVVVEWRVSDGVGRCKAQIRPEFALEDSFLST